MHGVLLAFKEAPYWPSLGYIGIYREIFPKNINGIIEFKNKSESNESHAKRLTPRTSTNLLIRNMFPGLKGKNTNSQKHNHEVMIYLGKSFEMKSRNPSRKTYQPIFRLGT